jgi:tight adherence protein B
MWASGAEMMGIQFLSLFATLLGMALGGYLVVTVASAVRQQRYGYAPPGAEFAAGRRTFSGFVAEERRRYGSGADSRRILRRIQYLLRSVLPAVAASAGLGLGSYLLTGIPALGVVGATAGLAVPWTLKRVRERRNTEQLRSAWPDACRHLVANLRVGDSLPHAISSLATSGPVELRPYFARFSRRYAATGDFDSAIEALGSELAFVGVDRHLSAMRLAHRSGGAELVSVLKTAAELAAERLQTERDIKARQSWTVTAARVSAAAPWVILLLLSLRPATAAVYSTALGTKVILGGTLSTALGYGLMLKIGKVPPR